jgi:subtilase family serine protease
LITLNAFFRRALSSIVAPLTVLATLGAGAPAVATAGHMAPALGLHPLVQYAGAASRPNATFACQHRTVGVCYGPQQIRAAYDIQPLLDNGLTGKRRTIVIVDAFQSPTIVQDLQLFDSVFGLADPTFNQIAPDGLTSFDPSQNNQVSWSAEISLDVEWAHAIAPDATIDLVLSKSDNDADILSALRYAVNHNLGDVISQSFGEAEICMDPALREPYHEVYQAAARKHISVFASSGDQGAAQPTCDFSSFIKSASTPATDPLVTAVGGTRLTADLSTGAYQGETVWNEILSGSNIGSGGGFSVLYRRPDYQRGVSGIGRMRAVPDVAYNAAVDGGVLGAWGVPFGVGAFFRFGGTSAGSPQWAGITAIADQAAGERLGSLNATLYGIGRGEESSRDLHDITVGNNTFTFVDAGGVVHVISGFNAVRGWDAATGWGTPRAAALTRQLAENRDSGGQGGGQ